MVEQRDIRVDDEERVAWATWSPAQFVALAIGALFVVMGAATLAKTGINLSSFNRPHVAVLGFHHTPLLGAIELLFGLLMVMAGAIPGAGRGTMTFLGVIALGFGIVVLIEPASLHAGLGTHTANGWLYVISGVVSLGAAIAAPVIVSRGSRAVRHDLDSIRR